MRESGARVSAVFSREWHTGHLSRLAPVVQAVYKLPYGEGCDQMLLHGCDYVTRRSRDLGRSRPVRQSSAVSAPRGPRRRRRSGVSAVGVAGRLI